EQDLRRALVAGVGVGAELHLRFGAHRSNPGKSIGEAAFVDRWPFHTSVPSLSMTRRLRTGSGAGASMSGPGSATSSESVASGTAMICTISSTSRTSISGVALISPNGVRAKKKGRIAPPLSVVSLYDQQPIPC